MKARPVTTFGEVIRKIRRSKGMSQEQLANNARLDRSYVGGIERNERNPTLPVIERLADGLGISLSEMFDGYSPRRDED